MKPTRIEFDVGRTRFNQTLRLIYERENGGVGSWTLIQDAASQRDETTTIRNLPAEAIERMAEAVKSIKP